MKTQIGLKWTLPVIVVASLLSAPAVCAGETALNLVQDGKAVYTVVVPDGKDAVAMSAATMLADAVKKASGARLAIVEETKAPARPKVFIGKTRAAVKDRLTKEISYWDHRAQILKAQEQSGKPNARLNSEEARKRADSLQAIVICKECAHHDALGCWLRLADPNALRLRSERMPFPSTATRVPSIARATTSPEAGSEAMAVRLAEPQTTGVGLTRKLL